MRSRVVNRVLLANAISHKLAKDVWISRHLWSNNNAIVCRLMRFECIYAYVEIVDRQYTHSREQFVRIQFYLNCRALVLSFFFLFTYAKVSIPMFVRFICKANRHAVVAFVLASGDDRFMSCVMFEACSVWLRLIGKAKRVKSVRFLPELYRTTQPF